MITYRVVEYGAAWVVERWIILGQYSRGKIVALRPSVTDARSAMAECAKHDAREQLARRRAALCN